MTVETKTTIQFSDIATIEFECNDCHSKMVWPLKIAKNPPMSCSCNRDKQWMPSGGDTQHNISRLIALLQDFSASKGEPYTIRLGLKNAS
jgi:hypothetical protein